MTIVLRAVLSLAAGYLVILLTVAALTTALAFVFGYPLDGGVADFRPSTGFSVLALIAGGIAALLGGTVASALAPRYPVAVGGWLLGGLLFGFGAAYQLIQFLRGIESGRVEPLWYLFLLPAVGLAGTLCGAVLQARRARAKARELLASEG